MPSAKPAHHAIAGRLGQITVDRRDARDHPPQPLGQPVRPALGAGEDDALAGIVSLEQMNQELDLAVVIHRDVILLDGLDRRLVLRQVDLDRLVHVPLGQLPDIGTDRGREQHGLVRVRHLAEDAFDVGTEADVEHPVGLVEDDVDDLPQVERAALDVVEHPAGRADDDVDPPAQGPQLPLDRLAAVDPADRHIACMCKLLQLTNDLLSQLAGGGQDDGLRAARPRLQHLDQGNAKGRRLAGAGLGLTDDVQTIKRPRDEGRLDGGGCGVAGMRQGLEHHRAQTHRMESRSGFLLGSSTQTILQKCHSCGDKWVVATKAARPA